MKTQQEINNEAKTLHNRLIDVLTDVRTFAKLGHSEHHKHLRLAVRGDSIKQLTVCLEEFNL